MGLNESHPRMKDIIMTLNFVKARRYRNSQITLAEQQVAWRHYVAEVMSNASKNGMK